MSPTERNGDPRIGVYVCHCGTNIAGTVDVEAVRSYAEGLPGVTVARAYKYMCSDPGQELIKEDIRANGLERVVVASCSPTLHEATFRRAMVWVSLSRLAGTVLAQILLVPAAVAIAWAAGWI